MSAINLMFSGIGGTAIGAFQFTKGHVKSSIQSIFLGLCAINIGGRLHGLDARAHGEVMKYTLTTSAGTMGVLGAVQLIKGIEQRNVSEIIKGTGTTVIGIAGAMAVYSLDSRTIIAVQQASILGVTSSLIGALGFKDLAKGHYRSGLCKTALGIAGIASAVFYVCYSFQEIELNPEQDLFPCMSHKEEIEEIYKTHREVGRWKKLGKGVSKIVFTHEECPGWVIKIPRFPFSEAVKRHYENLEDIRNIASQFERISLPKSHLYSTASGEVLIEEMLHLEPYQGSADQQETSDQFDHFVKTVSLCDLNPAAAHNAGILTGSTPPKMGIIDFDCRRRSWFDSFLYIWL